MTEAIEINKKQLNRMINAAEEKIEGLESERNRLRYLLAEICDELDHDQPDGPGHSHLVTGDWDNDNKPEIAGKPCSWCAIWREIREIVDNT